MKNNFDRKPGSLEEVINAMRYEEPGRYAKIFKRELEKAGKGIGAMSPQEKKDFFNKLDKMYHAKNEEAPTDADIKRLKKMGLKKEGTWALPDTPAQKAKLKKLLQSPIKLGKDGDEATDKMYDLIGDDSLLDDLYVAGKKNPNGDARPIIKKHMKRFGIREEEDMEESVEYVEYMAKNSGEASKIAAMFRGKTGGGEIHKSGSEVRIDSAKDIEAIHKQVVGKYPDTRVMTVETHVSQTKDANQKQKDAKGEKEIIKSVSETVLDMWREAAEKKKKDIAPDMDNIDEKEPKENTEKLKSEIEKKDDEIAMLKQKAETEKAKAVKKETEKMVNPETGEPLLQVGVAYKALRDKMKEESVKKENEEELKKKKMTDTGEKASEIDTKPEIKYEK